MRLVPRCRRAALGTAENVGFAPVRLTSPAQRPLTAAPLTAALTPTRIVDIFEEYYQFPFDFQKYLAEDKAVLVRMVGTKPGK